MTNDWLEARYEKDPNIVYREIAGEAILVPIRKRAADLESIYTLNETAAYVWAMVDGERTVQDMRDSLMREYSVSLETAQADLEELILAFEEIAAVVRKG